MNFDYHLQHDFIKETAASVEIPVLIKCFSRQVRKTLNRSLTMPWYHLVYIYIKNICETLSGDHIIFFETLK